MNWLAHAFLSDPDIEFRLGNLLADLVKGPDRAAMSDAFRAGVRQHQEIDVFTDAHEIVHRSRARIGGGYRRVSGILVDVFYDHFLALNWDRYSPEPLETFTTRLYAQIETCSLVLPMHAQMAITHMCGEDILGSYRLIEGIEQALRRVSARLFSRVQVDFALEGAVSELIKNFKDLENDFGEFFPLLRVRFAKEE